MEVLTSDSAVMLHYSARDTCKDWRVVRIGYRGIGCSAVLLYKSAMFICNECSDVCKGWRVQGSFACTYFSTVTSNCFGYMDGILCCW
jgi:hypothetical protein